MVLVTREVFVNTLYKLDDMNLIYTSLYFKYKVDGILCETSIINTAYGVSRVDSFYQSDGVVNIFSFDVSLVRNMKGLGDKLAS